jgi:hypothetical protein
VRVLSRRIKIKKQDEGIVQKDKIFKTKDKGNARTQCSKN